MQLDAIAASSRLDTLARQFDAKYARMQKPGFTKALGKALGRPAVLAWGVTPDPTVRWAVSAECARSEPG